MIVNGGDLNIILNETYIEEYITVMKFLLRIYILRIAHILKEQLIKLKIGVLLWFYFFNINLGINW